MRVLRRFLPRPAAAVTPACNMLSAGSIEREDRAALERRIRELGPWFHNYEIARDVWTNAAGAPPGPDYHLRHPLLALEAARKVCRGTLIFQTITTPHGGRIEELEGVSQDVQLNSAAMLHRRFPAMQFVEGGLATDVTCWFVPNVEAVPAILRSCGFLPQQFILSGVQEVFVRCTVA